MNYPNRIKFNFNIYHDLSRNFSLFEIIFTFYEIKIPNTYIIKCKDLVHKSKKYVWPSDAPTIKKTYYQQFTFDIASNDLVDYEFKSFTEEIANNRW